MAAQSTIFVLDAHVAFMEAAELERAESGGLGLEGLVHTLMPPVLPGLAGFNQFREDAPHRTPESMTRDEIAPLVEFSVEMRKRVIDQLAVMKPEEFQT